MFAHVNRNKRLTARVLQLRHPSGSLINSNQEMAELLKTPFLGFFREDEGSTPVLQPRTQTKMADPLITELEISCALDGLNPHKGAGPDRLFFEVLKALTSHIAPVLARMLAETVRIQSDIIVVYRPPSQSFNLDGILIERLQEFSRASNIILTGHIIVKNGPELGKRQSDIRDWCLRCSQ